MEQSDLLLIVKSLFLTIHNLSVQTATLRGILQSKGVFLYQDFDSLYRKIHESAKNQQIREAVSDLSVDSDVNEILQRIAKAVS